MRVYLFERQFAIGSYAKSKRWQAVNVVNRLKM
ncbi:hypothetical protein PYK22_01880 [Pyrinomonas methylaliphatogenes]|uniref:Uncharacterized protein n=1 Tax=Pyrinomonas methylaliphatogenes TaxID=454194 RepID=A0A0B6WYR4_9BACT|nr:hypothetical protein PYK22_01880 [Pyrinomonas methylaliphatogenes]